MVNIFVPMHDTAPVGYIADVLENPVQKVPAVEQAGICRNRVEKIEFVHFYFV